MSDTVPQYLYVPLWIQTPFRPLFLGEKLIKSSSPTNIHRVFMVGKQYNTAQQFPPQIRHRMASSQKNF
jgi:hypothetical protein